MNILELVAAAQSAEPNMKVAMKHRYTLLRGKRVYIFPASGCSEHKAREYTEPYQPMSEVEWNRAVMDGTAYGTGQ